MLWLYKETNGSGLPGGFFDEAVALQGLDHFVDRGWGNLEVALQIRLCRSLAVDFGVAVDEGQVLTLLGGLLLGRAITQAAGGVPLSALRSTVPGSSSPAPPGLRGLASWIGHGGSTKRKADQLGFEIEPDAGTTAEFDIGV